MRRVITAVAVLFLAFASIAVAQEDTKIMMSRKKAQELVPREFMKPVKSFLGPEAVVLDTIETQTPGVKILLMADNSWKYWRDPKDITTQTLFITNWDENQPNPYRLEYKDLPSSINLMLTDSTNNFCCPHQRAVYSRFGYRRGRRHQGVDLPLHKGDSVRAAFSGKVRMSKYYAAFGNLIIIRHENGLETFYGHLSQRFFEPGDWVEAGQVIGLGGSTGRSTGPHLHFETRYKGYAFDPQWIIDFEKGLLRKSFFVLRKSYLSAASRYVAESIDEEEEIYIGDTRDYAVADSLAAVRKAEEERKAAEAAAMKYYKIKSGDTLGRIAINNHTTVSAICRLNPGLTPKSTLKIGRTIRVK